jgi:hypothetical protein
VRLHAGLALLNPRSRFFNQILHLGAQSPRLRDRLGQLAGAPLALERQLFKLCRIVQQVLVCASCQNLVCELPDSLSSLPNGAGIIEHENDGTRHGWRHDLCGASIIGDQAHFGNGDLVLGADRGNQA